MVTLGNFFPPKSYLLKKNIEKMNKSISFAITETAARVKFMQEKGYKQRTIRLYLVQQKERHGITKVALKKFYKHKYGQELIIRR